MYRWCSYCLKYLGEKEPFAITDVTHGVCKQCKKNPQKSLIEGRDRVEELETLIASVRQQALESRPFDVSTLTARLDQLGLSHMDFALGVIQPILSEVGDHYADGKLSVTAEHRFSNFANFLLDQLLIGAQKKSNLEGDVDMLLACSDGNYHSLGVKLISVFLWEHGVSNLLIYPSIPEQELVDYARQYRCKALGVSVAERENLKIMMKRLEALHRLIGDPELIIYLGGPAVRAASMRTESQMVKCVRSLEDLHQLIADLQQR